LEVVPLRILDRVIVFDYGEVISRSPNERDRAELLAIADVAAEPFWASYDAHRDALDRGDISVTDYWAAVASDTGSTWGAATVQQLWAADFRS
jgi:putative hydrolase of the HAD superfamily